MEVLLIVIFIIILVIAIKNSNQAANNNVTCSYHKWVYMKQPDVHDEYMICHACQKTPSEIVNSVDKE